MRNPRMSRVGAASNAYTNDRCGLTAPTGVQRRARRHPCGRAARRSGLVRGPSGDRAGRIVRVPVFGVVAAERRAPHTRRSAGRDGCSNYRSSGRTSTTAASTWALPVRARASVGVLDPPSVRRGTRCTEHSTRGAASSRPTARTGRRRCSGRGAGVSSPATDRSRPLRARRAPCRRPRPGLARPRRGSHARDRREAEEGCRPRSRRSLSAAAASARAAR